MDVEKYIRSLDPQYVDAVLNLFKRMYRMSRTKSLTLFALSKDSDDGKEVSTTYIHADSFVKATIVAWEIVQMNEKEN